MNKKFFIAWIVVFIAWFVAGWVINVTFLMSEWMQVSILREWEEELKRYHFMVLPFVLYAGTAVWIYARSVQRKPWVTQGLQFGVFLSLITIVPMRMLNYTTMNMPGAVIVKEVIYWTIALLLIGVLIAAFYRKESAA